MAKILQFPKEKTTRAKVIQKSFNQKAVIPLSLLSVLVVTLSLNEWIQIAAKSLDQSRGVASLVSEDLEKQIKWEHKWADSLRQVSSVSSGVVAEKPAQLDQLLFGVLQGDVKLNRSGSLVQSLEMKKPLELKNREEFLETFREVWSVQFAKVELVEAASQKEVYRLLDQKGNPVGSAVFGLESLQNVTKLEFLTLTK
jgi:hypothetical protein